MRNRLGRLGLGLLLVFGCCLRFRLGGAGSSCWLGLGFLMRVTPEYKARDTTGDQRHYHNNRYDDW